MMNKIWIACASAMLSLGCGDGASSSNNDNNAANNGANNTPQGAWTATVTDSEVEFPPVDGGPPTKTTVANRVTLVGAIGDGAISMTMELEFDGGTPVAGDLAPRRFVLTYALPVDAEPAERTSYVCGNADGFTVSVTSAEPLGGTFEGPLTCAPQAMPMNSFGANVTGDFTAID